jgi:hypothetical protein
MIRILLVLVAVLVAVLAFVFDRPWLYAAAGAPLLGALGLLGRHLWAAYQQDPSTTPPPASPEDASMEDLGIMDVRPQERDGGSNGASGADEEPSAGENESQSDESHSEASSPAERAARSAAETEPSSPAPPRSAVAVSEERPVLGPFLESLRAALVAETVALLVQEEVVLEYRVEALASAHPDVQRTGHFETRSPLLTATMSRQPVTVRTLDGEEERADLGFYERPPAIEQVAVAPVPQPDTAATVFLLADATAETDLGASQTRSVLEQYADTVSLLWTPDAAPAGRERAPAPDPNGADETMPPDDSAEARADAPRPRREIIAEEMRAADAGDDELALVLVHLNRAESIARRGEEAVDRAEQLLRTRLEHLAPGQRVERFGELTYGLFPRRGLEAVEAWAADLQDAMAQETGELEGGVSMGVAVRGPRHDAEELRADATEALREAYETGTCTIVA